MNKQSDSESGPGLWVVTQPGADGRYQLVVHFDDDNSLSLSREAAHRYAAAILSATARAEFDAAVLALLTVEIGMPVNQAGEVIQDLREKRAAADDEATAPARFHPGVSARTQKPFLDLFLNGKQLCQLDSPAAREHAMYVMETVQGQELDNDLFDYLTKVITLDPMHARSLIAGLATVRKG